MSGLLLLQAQSFTSHLLSTCRAKNMKASQCKVFAHMDRTCDTNNELMNWIKIKYYFVFQTVGVSVSGGGCRREVELQICAL